VIYRVRVVLSSFISMMFDEGAVDSAEKTIVDRTDLLRER